jgi:hypothetical protein
MTHGSSVDSRSNNGIHGRRSFRLDIRELDYFSPFRDFGSDERLAFGGCHGHGSDAEVARRALSSGSAKAAATTLFSNMTIQRSQRDLQLGV